MKRHAEGLRAAWLSLAIAGSFVAPVVGLVAGSPAQAAFVDPLDTPAPMAVRPAQGLSTAVARAAADRWVAVGRRGQILVSNDGTAWKQVASPVSTDLVSVFFLDAKRGWAAGHGGVILATNDGGQTWAKQLDGRQAAELLVGHYQAASAAGPTGNLKEDLADAQSFQKQGPGRPFLDVWFADAQHGYAVGAFNLLFTTDDGGARWVPHPDHLANDKRLHLSALRSVGDEAFLAGEQGLLARLNAQTRKFDLLKAPYGGSYFGLIGGKGRLVIFGLQGNAFRSDDGGATWRKLETGTQATINCGTVTDSGQWVLGTQSGTLLVSQDGGDHFTAITPAEVAPIFGVAPAAGEAVIIAGPRGVRRVSLK